MKEKMQKVHIAEPLLAWYHKNKRDLPWRKTQDPYAILVSEMMLQQTQVNTVIDYYHRFLARFESFEALANAKEQDVLAAWQGLGYYSRARNLHRLAKRVVADYAGKLPSDPEALRELPGIGDYMCGAVMSIAFGKPVPAVDGNVLRVVTRVVNLHEDITKTSAKKKVTALVDAWIPKDSASDFTQAMMELGALICNPKSPDCELCPLREVCQARAKGTVAMLPVKTAKQKPTVAEYYVLLVVAKDHLLMQQQSEGRLLAGMWGLPMAEKQKDVSMDEAAAHLLHIDLPSGQVLGDTNHVFTHRRWEMTIVWYSLPQKTPIMGYHWQEIDQIEDIPVPIAFKKAINWLSVRIDEKKEEK